MLIAQFPTATKADIFSPIEIKKFFYHAMPNHWRTNFINSGQNVHQALLDELRTYIVAQESQTYAHCKKVRDPNKKNQNKKPFNRNYKGYKHNRRYNSSNHKTGETKDHKNYKKLSNDDDCPIHGASHKWGQCHRNQYGDNFRPKRSSAASQTGSMQSRSHCSSFHTGPPNQVQIFANERQTQPDNFDNRSHLSN